MYRHKHKGLPDWDQGLPVATGALPSSPSALLVRRWSPQPEVGAFTLELAEKSRSQGFILCAVLRLNSGKDRGQYLGEDTELHTCTCGTSSFQQASVIREQEVLLPDTLTRHVVVDN